MPLLEVRHLVKHYPAGKKTVHAVDDVSFTVEKGETLGLVGESGCGKSTTGRIVVRLLEPTSGQVLFDGVDVFTQRGSSLHALRRRLQIVFQDPYASLNPRMTLGSILAEPLRVQRMDYGPAQLSRLLDMVGLSDEFLQRYPHELSGGQRQRVGIARALATEPQMIVADEPVSALDVSIQAQIVNLLQDLQQRMGLSYLFVSHDITVVRHISNRIAVMYLGRLVEMGPAAEVVDHPLHPYTQALIRSIPQPRVAPRRPAAVSGDVPSPTFPPSGCRFHTRCPFVASVCRTDVPQWRELSPAHFVACHKAPITSEGVLP